MKENVKKLCEIKNHGNKKNEVEFVSVECSAWLQASPSESDSGNVRCHPYLALGSLFEATSNPQSLAVSFRCGCVWDGPHLSALLAFHHYKAQGWIIQHLKVPPPPDSICSPAVSVSLLLTYLFLRGLLVRTGG